MSICVTCSVMILCKKQQAHHIHITDTASLNYSYAYIYIITFNKNYISIYLNLSLYFCCIFYIMQTNKIKLIFNIHKYYNVLNIQSNIIMCYMKQQCNNLTLRTCMPTNVHLVYAHAHMSNSHFSSVF